MVFCTPAADSPAHWRNAPQGKKEVKIMGKMVKVIKKLIGNITDWWYVNDNIFCFNIEISLLRFIVEIKIITIRFKVDIELPYFFNYFTNIFCRYRFLTKNKIGEIELTFMNNLATGISIYKNIHCDHAQIVLRISILGLAIEFKIYDTRHWDDEKNSWEK
jgi:hypothetical protein